MNRFGGVKFREGKLGFSFVCFVNKEELFKYYDNQFRKKYILWNTNGALD